MSARTRQKQARRRRRPGRNASTTECLLCGKHFRSLTSSHLRKHNYTRDQYDRTFGLTGARQGRAGRQAASQAGSSRPAPRNLPEQAAALSSATVAERLLNSETFLQRLTDEVGELLFTSGLRDQLRLALVQTLGKRLEIHAAAVANLERVRAELSQDWRVERGGKDGSPTPTPHLVMMAGEAHQEVTKAEEALLKAVKLAVEEQRGNKEAARADSRPAFTGQAESIPVPPSLPAHERETIRTLFGLLREEVTSRRQDGQAQPRVLETTALQTPSTQGGAPAARGARPELSTSPAGSGSEQLGLPRPSSGAGVLREGPSSADVSSSEPEEPFGLA